MFEEARILGYGDETAEMQSSRRSVGGFAGQSGRKIKMDSRRTTKTFD